MAGQVMNTRPIAATLRDQFKREVDAFKTRSGITPSVVIISIGQDSNIVDYIRVASRVAAQVGVRAYAHVLPVDITMAELKQHFAELNANPNLHAVALQTPLPPHLSVSDVAALIRPDKEVEGMSPLNVGAISGGNARFVPPPAQATMKLLSLYSISPAGKNVAIIGRSLAIGKPLATLLTDAHATVTVCHSRTSNLVAITCQADIVITAVQNPGLISADMVKRGSVVIDYGITFVGDKIVGDVRFEEVRQVVDALTPMPGGTGPLTVISLLQNTLKAATLAHAKTNGTSANGSAASLNNTILVAQPN